MADQKALKKRLKALMQRPENQVCSDCPEKRPTWASLLVPPPGAPAGTEKIGSFTCLECSGSHRRLGVHIAFVRSVNLDSWKEWEVLAMENGGNAKVNAIFEAKLAESGRTQPSNLADGPTRERFIRDKYERRKFYDPAGFSFETGSGGAQASINVSDGSISLSHSRPGAPSDIARRRVASRQARMKPIKSNEISTKVPATKITEAPVSAPVEFDLLDFGSESTPACQTPSVTGGGDLFSSQPNTAPADPTTQSIPFSSGMQKSSIPPPPKTAPPTTTSTSRELESLNNPSPHSKPTKSNDDIMALFGPSKQQQQLGFGMNAMNQMGSINSANASSITMNGIAMQTQNHGQQPNVMAMNNQQNISQQRQQMAIMMNNMNMMANGNQMQTMPNQMMQQQMMPNQMTQQQMMPNQMTQQQMMSNQMMQQQMMMQKHMMMQQRVANQPQSNNSGNGLNGLSSGSAFNNNNINLSIQGIQNMSLGNATSRQTGDDGGFGTPMGGSSQQQSMKEDAFSSLGGMNAFR